MTFKLLIFTSLLAIARASFINGGHGLDPVIGSSYVANAGQLIRTGSPSYPSPYGYPLAPGRSYPSGISGSLVLKGVYGSPYNPYNSRNLPVGVSSYSGPSIHGYGTRTLSYPSSPSYSSYSSAGFHGGFEGGYGNGYSSAALQNYVQPHQPIAHGSFNGLGNGYHGY